MIKRIARISSEAFVMACKNYKTYIMLSVTIIFTFTFVGFFLFGVDSFIFNKYKNCLKISSKVAMASYYSNEKQKADNLKKKLNEYENTYWCETIEIRNSSKNTIIPGSDILEKSVIHIIDEKGIWGYYYNTDYIINRKDFRMELVSGEKSVHLKQGETIVNESLYKLITKISKPQEDGYYYVDVPISSGINNIVERFKIVDVCRDSVEIANEKNEKSMTVELFIVVDEKWVESLEGEQHKMTIYSEELSDVMEEIKNSGVSGYDFPIISKNTAKEIIVKLIYLKALIVILILFVMGINMYSCFSNALQERKFEIGVKRALGAKKTDIVMQFFAEGIVIMTVDLLIAIAFINILLITIKVVMEMLLDVNWAIIVYPNTMGIFLICCLFLSTFFSLLFAVQATRVEVIKYIKRD